MNITVRIRPSQFCMSMKASLGVKVRHVPACLQYRLPPLDRRHIETETGPRHGPTTPLVVDVLLVII